MPASVDAPPQRRLLLVEASISLSFAIKAKLEKEADVEIVLARSIAEAKEAIRIYDGQFFLSLLALSLPDGSGDEVVSVTLGADIPTIVFTGTFSSDLRDRLFSLGVIDYLIKDSPDSLNYMINVIKRLQANSKVTALVVDDSKTARTQLTALLKKFQFNVKEAEDGVKALEVLATTPNTRLVITDYNMPGMDGCELSKAIRQQYGSDQIAIIGISGGTDEPLSAKFLKFGANDFLNKPFVREEFYCRVAQNMQYLDQVQALQEAAARDPLTGLHNRRYFFEKAEAALSQAKLEDANCAVGMVDIDFFKNINDSYGHLIGDDAITHIAKLTHSFAQSSGDLVARIGGDEYCVFLYGTDEQEAAQFFEELRQKIVETPLVVDGLTVDITASIGVCGSKALSLNQLIDEADRALYSAKINGRDQICCAADAFDYQQATG
ncbi:MAG: diguanylate cyclase [Rhodobacteraceae bacterium]|nr:diguanylate cyclase [Paracoccaceae bacterium]